MMRQKSTTTYPVQFLLVSNEDHITGKTGLTPTVTISKNGGSFNAASGAVTELANGVYSWAGNATDRNTLGELMVHVSASGADPVDIKMLIVDFDPFTAIGAILDDTGSSGVAIASGQTITNLTNLPTMPADWITASGLKTDAVTKIQNGLATPTNVWENATRTLTQSAASVVAVVSGSDITCQRGDSLSASLTDVGALTGYSKVYFTVKADSADADSASLIQIEKAGGLLYLNGAAGTSAKGSLTIDDEATGDITIALDESETAKLSPGVYLYDVQVVRTAGTVSTLTNGNFTVAADITRATA